MQADRDPATRTRIPNGHLVLRACRTLRRCIYQRRCVTLHTTRLVVLSSVLRICRDSPLWHRRVARVSSEKSMQIRIKHRSCSERPERCTAPLADKENLDSKTEGVSALLVTLSIRIIAGEGERRGKFRRTVSFAWRCRSPSGRAWQPREFSRPFAGCLCPRRRASEAMPSTLARHVWDRRFGVHTGDGGARANSNNNGGALGSGLHSSRRRSTTNRPSHLQAPCAFCSLAWRALPLRLRDDETAGVVPWCDCASGQRLFRLSCRLHRRDDAACSLLRTTIRAAACCSSSTTEHQRLLLACTAAFIYHFVGGHIAVRTYIHAQ